MEKQEVITVAKGTVYRYVVERYKRHDDGFVLGYNFLQVEPDHGRFIFNVLVTEYVWMEFKPEQSVDLDRKAISLGLRNTGKVGHMGVVKLRMKVLEQLRSEDAMRGVELQVSILKFLRSVNTIRPAQQIPRHSVWYNTAGATVDISQHLDALVEKDWLLGEKNTSDVIDGKRVHYDIVYRVSPKKEVEIDAYIKDADPLVGAISDGPLRAFISYSHEDRKLAGEIKRYLEAHGMVAFLAHDDIKVSEEWEVKIRKELSECDIFVPLLTDNFRPSKWTDQEAGFAIGLGKAVFPLMVRDIPHGFLERIQAFKLDIDNIETACEKIIAVIREDEKLSPLLSKAQPKQAT